MKDEGEPESSAGARRRRPAASFGKLGPASEVDDTLGIGMASVGLLKAGKSAERRSARNEWLKLSMSINPGKISWRSEWVSNGLGEVRDSMSGARK